MMRRSRYKGIFSIDAMMSIIPLMLLSVFLIRSMSLAALSAKEQSERADLFDKLVTISDYTVKSGAAKHEGLVRHPNWIDEGNIDDGYIESLRQRADLSRLDISFSEPVDYPECIYRLVVVGPEKRISKLFFCGE